MTENSTLFYELIKYLENSNRYKQILLNLDKKYKLRTFKYQFLNLQAIIKLFERLKYYYQFLPSYISSKQISDSWCSTQKRVYQWFTIFYIYLLEENNQQITQSHWKNISALFFNKNISVLMYQYFNFIRQKGKIIWTPEDDVMLLNAVKQIKQGCWYNISKHIFINSGLKIFKSPRHCKERFFIHFNDKNKIGNWTLQEDQAILQYVNKHGKRWSKIVQILKSCRTQHTIKWRYNSFIIKNSRNPEIKNNVETMSNSSLDSSQQIDTEPQVLQTSQNIHLQDITQFKRQQKPTMGNNEQKKIEQEYIIQMVNCQTQEKIPKTQHKNTYPNSFQLTQNYDNLSLKRQRKRQNFSQSNNIIKEQIKNLQEENHNLDVNMNQNSQDQLIQEWKQFQYNNPDVFLQKIPQNQEEYSFPLQNKPQVNQNCEIKNNVETMSNFSHTMGNNKQKKIEQEQKIILMGHRQTQSLQKFVHQQKVEIKLFKNQKQYVQVKENPKFEGNNLPKTVRNNDLQQNISLHESKQLIEVGVGEEQIISAMIFDNKQNQPLQTQKINTSRQTLTQKRQVIKLMNEKEIIMTNLSTDDEQLPQNNLQKQKFINSSIIQSSFQSRQTSENILENYHNIIKQTDNFLLHKDDDKKIVEQFEKLLNKHIYLRFTPGPKTSLGQQLFKNGLFLVGMINLITRSSNKAYTIYHVFMHVHNFYGQFIEENKYIYSIELQHVKHRYEEYLNQSYQQLLQKHLVQINNNTQNIKSNNNNNNLQTIKRKHILQVQQLPYIRIQSVDKINNQQQTTPKKNHMRHQCNLIDEKIVNQQGPKDNSFQKVVQDNDPRHPKYDIQYKELSADQLPKTESLKTTIDRVLPYQNNTIVPTVKSVKRVIIVAHGNGLSAILKGFSNASQQDITQLNFDQDFKDVKEYNYLADPEDLEQQINKDKKQTGEGN